MRKLLLSLFILFASVTTQAQWDKVTIDKSVAGLNSVYKDEDQHTVTYTIKDVNSYNDGEDFSFIAIREVDVTSLDAALMQAYWNYKAMAEESGAQIIEYKPETVLFSDVIKVNTFSLTMVDKSGKKTYYFVSFLEINFSTYVYVAYDTDNGKYISKMKAAFKTMTAN